MIEAAAVCVTNEESRRPGIHEVIAILKGEEEPVFSKRKKSSFLGNGSVIDCYSQLQQSSEMKSHLALAMLGVSEFEDDDYLYSLDCLIIKKSDMVSMRCKDTNIEVSKVRPI
ncbi:proline-rich receptor-like protein kinase PERK13-like protein, partial [Trifolium pratense]